ncbi:MAG: DNA methylase [Coprobacillaceae bacterium]
MTKQRIFIAIDLKSFYASVECVERGLDPLTTNLVVADASRTQKTICLAVSPSLKPYNIPGRPRLFEVEQKVKEANYIRASKVNKRKLVGTSFDDTELQSNPNLAISYITATPRMAYYIEYSTKIYDIYLKYVSPEDIHVYSIDEVFIDATTYLNTYKLTPHDFTMMIIEDVLNETGITATAGIGTNMYLSKVAMDIVAKHTKPDAFGVRIAESNEMTYRKLLWNHKPITDFWRVGRGYTKKLHDINLYTMGDIARCSINNEDILFDIFGINAELLIDHAWGQEPCTISDIKSYKPTSNSLGSGQVLHCAYPSNKARIIVQEMIDHLALELVGKGLVSDQVVLTVGYDIENISDNKISNTYKGEIKKDYYGRTVPKSAHGTQTLKYPTSSTRLLTKAMLTLYDRIVDKSLLVRRITISANRVVLESNANNLPIYEQLDIFTNIDEQIKMDEKETIEVEREKRLNQAILDIKKKYGKNKVVKAMNLQDGATELERNEQIGGHKS